MSGFDFTNSGDSVDVGADPAGGSGNSGYDTTPPDFSGGGGPGVNVGADPSGGTSTTPFTSEEIAALVKSGGLSIDPSILAALSKIPGAGKGGSNPFSMTNPDGSMNWASLVPLLAAIFGGTTAYNATKTGSKDIVNALNSANTQATNLLGPGSGAMAGYKPYQTVGEMAAGKLGAYNYKPLASSFPAAVKGG